MTGQPPPPRCQDAPVPPVEDLTWRAYQGYDCYACGRRLTTGAVYRGWARGQSGAHKLDTEVWACP